MSPIFRLLLTLLLALALPLQGGFAAAMMCRAPVQHGMGDTTHRGAPADPQALPDHCAGAMVTDKAGSHACTACAACCIAGALTPATLPSFIDVNLHQRPLAARALPSSFITEGTERPPRPVLA